MRALFLILTLCLPMTAHAGLLDLLPLKRIERKMLYPLSTVEVPPADIGLNRAKAHDLDHAGHRLVVWTVLTAKPNAPTVLYFHGNAGNLAVRGERFALFQKQGINVIAMSYRGSSGSESVPSEAGITADALHVFNQVPSLISGATAEEIVLYGESLGSAVAISLLEKLPAHKRPAGLILEAPFTSTPAMARTMAELPENLIARISDRWDSLSRAASITVPMLVLHGSADEVTPIEMGRKMFRAAAIKDKDFIAVPNASHSATWRNETMPKIWRFIHAYGGR